MEIKDSMKALLEIKEEFNEINKKKLVAEYNFVQNIVDWIASVEKVVVLNDITSVRCFKINMSTVIEHNMNLNPRAYCVASELQSYLNTKTDKMREIKKIAESKKFDGVVITNKDIIKILDEVNNFLE